MNNYELLQELLDRDPGFMPNRTLAQAVADTAAILDEHVPGWHQKVNTNTLRVEDASCCLLQQVFGLYTTGLITFAGWASPWIEGHEDGECSLVFCSPKATFHWAQEVHARRTTVVHHEQEQLIEVA